MEQTDENPVEGVLPGPTQAQAGQGDADLRHREQAPGVGEQAERGLGAGLPLLRHLPEPRVAHGKQCHFSAREEAVDGDQQNHQQYAKWGVGHVIPNHSSGVSYQDGEESRSLTVAAR